MNFEAVSLAPRGPAKILNECTHVAESNIPNQARGPRKIVCASHYSKGAAVLVQEIRVEFRMANDRDRSFGGRKSFARLADRVGHVCVDVLATIRLAQ